MTGGKKQILMRFRVISHRKSKKKIYFIFDKYKKNIPSRIENISNSTRATQSWNNWYFQHIRWHIFGIHLKKVNILCFFHNLLKVVISGKYKNLNKITKI